MRLINAVILFAFWSGMAGADCTALSFDYSSFSRPPGKMDINRYVAGHQDTNYLSVGLHGMTLQISPANTAQDQDLPQIWENWRVQGDTHPDYLSFHTYHTRPELVETPFDQDTKGYHSVQTGGGANVIEFIFFHNMQGNVLASAYINDPVGDAVWSEVVGELATLLTIDKACISDTGRYEGKYDNDVSRYVILPAS